MNSFLFIVFNIEYIQFKNYILQSSVLNSIGNMFFQLIYSFESSKGYCLFYLNETMNSIRASIEKKYISTCILCAVLSLNAYIGEFYREMEDNISFMFYIDAFKSNFHLNASYIRCYNF